jgi:hypothetical protein
MRSASCDVVYYKPMSVFTWVMRVNFDDEEERLCNLGALREKYRLPKGHTKQTDKLRCLSPRANYTDRVTAACRRS